MPIRADHPHHDKPSGAGDLVIVFDVEGKRIAEGALLCCSESREVGHRREGEGAGRGLEEIKDMISTQAVVGEVRIGLVLLAPGAVVEGIVRVAEPELDVGGLHGRPGGGDKVGLEVAEGHIEPCRVVLKRLVKGRGVLAIEAASIDGSVADNLAPCPSSSTRARVDIEAHSPLAPCSSIRQSDEGCKGMGISEGTGA